MPMAPIASSLTGPVSYKTLRIGNLHTYRHPTTIDWLVYYNETTLYKENIVGVPARSQVREELDQFHSGL